MLVLLALHAAVALVLPWWARRFTRTAWYLAAAVPLATAVWAGLHAPEVLAGGTADESWAWAPALGLVVDLRLDGLSMLMLWVVGGVGAAVLLYSRHYTQHDPGRESALLLAFAGVMTGLVLADNLFVLYVFWELTTVVSFLLIAGRGNRAERRRAAVQALLVTAGGGLAMLFGFVLLGEAAGTYRVSAIVADPPRGGAVTAAVVLVLIGAFAKSAQMPLHSWLPAAMVAPTPVSAYLHAATMVKAGVYLVARLAPGLAPAGPWRPMVFTVGLASLVLGAWCALRETDLKKLLAYGTISELGMLIALLGAGTRTAALAGAVLLLAHAAFKAALFLVTGIIDHRIGTRDIRELSGVGRRLPVLFAVAVLATASMAGLPPLIGFLGKEAAFEAFLHAPGFAAHGWLLAALVLGSALTVTYAVRFLAGAFGGASRPGDKEPRPPAAGFVAPAAVLAAAGLVGGLWASGTDRAVRPYADGYPAGPDAPYEPALWHGLTPVLGLSALAVLAGVLLHLVGQAGMSAVSGPSRAAPPQLPGEQPGYRRTLAALDEAAARLTRRTQVGSLPVYLAVILTTVVLLPGSALAAMIPRIESPPLWRAALELPLGAGVLAAAAMVLTTRYRLTGVLLVGATGYGVAGLFLVRGAPDLALTQFLVETMTLVVVVLVLRRMPARFTPGGTTGRVRTVRAAVAVAVGLFVATFALVAASARRSPSVASDYFRRADEAGAHNVVNAVIVDFRALDTLGEISVLLVTSIGVVSLVRIWNEARPSHPDSPRAPGQPDDSPRAHWDEPREKWLPGADERAGSERSVLLEVVTRLLFPSILVLSLFLLFSGHSHPGGGFAGGLVAGQAFVLRYLVGGRADPGTAAPLGAGALAGGGLVLASAVGVLPLLFGGPPLAATVVTARLPVFGKVEFATSLFFDMGVYLLVVGVTLTLLSAAGVALGRSRDTAMPGRAAAPHGPAPDGSGAGGPGGSERSDEA
ncbi:Na+/H+ antiporter subunit A [Streptomyces peucetius]|uniref:Na+/H+ antiporter subunit A n=1 Tax=Streptomyces peucetius TaxID=1950 RepID=A0ABY6I0T5_STRPE|nr:Na+/H+ antiporter subunit A [Streptomyces peucetius]UYQ60582.1 Na+/H+ antiporter subunit A [Streptomyces peucetius]